MSFVIYKKKATKYLKITQKVILSIFHLLIFNLRVKMTNKMVIFFEQVKEKTRATIHHQAQFIFLSYFVKIISSNKNLFFQLYLFFFEQQDMQEVRR